MSKYNDIRTNVLYTDRTGNKTLKKKKVMIEGKSESNVRL